VSQINFTSGSGDPYDLTDYKNTNWTSGKEEYKHNVDNRFNIIQREMVADNQDFIGEDILIPSLDGVGNTKKIDFSSFYFDLIDTRDAPSRYSDLSTNQFMLLQADRSETAVTESPTGFTPVTPYGYSVSYSGANKTLTASTISGSTTIGTLSLDGMAFQEGREYELIIDATLPTNSFAAFTFGVSDPLLQGYFYTIVNGRNSVTFTFPKTEGGSTPQKIYLHLQLRDAATTMIIDVKDSDPLNDWIEKEFEYRSEKGNVLGGADKYNYKYSLAYIDDVAGAYELPDTTATINGVSQSVEKKKDKELNDIEFPLADPTEIDFNYKITTDAGEVEPIELIVNLDGSPAKMKGEF